MPLQIVGLGGEERKIVVLNAPLEPSGHSIIQKKFAHPVQTAPPLKESEAKDVVCIRQYLKIPIRVFPILIGFGLLD